MDTVERAKKFATIMHFGQYRKIGPLKPYIVHPTEVANILMQYDAKTEIVAAGYLHDILEETECTIQQLTNLFGDEIARLVVNASDTDTKASWWQRKIDAVLKTRYLDFDSRLLIAADKVSNIEDLYFQIQIKGEIVFDYFNKPKTCQEWYYTNMYRSITLNDLEQHSLFNRFKKDIEKVFFSE